ncbi:MAG: hypothetical protein K1X55_09355 [Chitinophagales bacterium]|nr:hypothetical protein [Chitinophagales bacterium]
MKAIKIMKIVGKLLSLLSALPVIVFLTYYIMASIKLGEFATVESDYNPFYDVFFKGGTLYDVFTLTFAYLVYYLTPLYFIPYIILSIFLPKLRLERKYYLIWIISIILLIAIYLSNLLDWMFY